MTRKLSTRCALVLVLAIGSGAWAQADAPAEFEVVSGFVEALSRGDAEAALALVTDDALFTSHRVFWELSLGAEGMAVLAESIISDRARWEVELVSVMSEGRAVLTRDRFSAHGCGPLTFTTLWVVTDGMLLGASSIMDADNYYDRLVSNGLEGTWRYSGTDGETFIRYRFG